MTVLVTVVQVVPRPEPGRGGGGVLIKRAGGGPSRASTEVPASDRVLRRRPSAERPEEGAPGSSVPGSQWLPRGEVAESSDTEDEGAGAEQFRLAPRKRPRS